MHACWLEDTPAFFMGSGKTQVCGLLNPRQSLTISPWWRQRRPRLLSLSVNWSSALWSKTWKEVSVVLPTQQERKLTLHFLIRFASAWVLGVGGGVAHWQQEGAGLIVYAPWHGLEGITVTRYELISRFTMNFLRFSASPDNLAGGKKKKPLSDFFFCLNLEMCHRNHHLKKNTVSIILSRMPPFN